MKFVIAALLLASSAFATTQTEQILQIDPVYDIAFPGTNQAFLAGSVYASVAGTSVNLVLVNSQADHAVFATSPSTCPSSGSPATSITVTAPSPIYICVTQASTQLVAPQISASAAGFPTTYQFLPVYSTASPPVTDLTYSLSATFNVPIGAGYHASGHTVAYVNGDVTTWLTLGSNCGTSTQCTVGANFPTTLGQHAALVTITSTNGSSTASFTEVVTLTNVGSLLAVLPPLYRPYTTGQSYGSGYVLTAVNGTGSYSFSATGLPPGITLASNGTFLGTMTGSSVYQPVVTVTDSAGNVTTTALTFATPTFSFTPNPKALTSQGSTTPVLAGWVNSNPPNESVTLSAPLNDFNFSSDPSTCPASGTNQSITLTTPSPVYVCPYAPWQGIINYLLSIVGGGAPLKVVSFQVIIQGIGQWIELTPGQIDLSQTGSITAAVNMYTGTNTPDAGTLNTENITATVNGNTANSSWIKTSSLPLSCGINGCLMNISINWAGVTPQPTPGQTYTASVQFAGNQGGAGNIDVTFVAPAAVTVSSNTSFSGVPGQNFNATLSASGGAGAPYTWKAQNLPPGLSMSSSGQITGMVQAGGTWQSTITVQDFVGETTAQSASFVFSCPATLSIAGQTFSDSANSGVVLVAVNNCPWVASNGGSSWVSITSGANGTGNAAVTFAVQANTTGNTRTATLSIANQPFTVTQTASPSSPLRFVPLTPCRVVDTRSSNTGGPFMAGGQQRNFTIANNGVACSGAIPGNAAAYAVNVTVVPHGPLGYLTIFPAGVALPTISTLNSLDGRVKANGAILPAGTNGQLAVFASNDTDVVLDVAGYFVPASSSGALAFYPLAPCRVADTRYNTYPSGLGPPSLVGQATARQFPILGSNCKVPTTAQAYSLNFTAVPKNGTLGYMTVFPTGQMQPLASTLNAPTGTVVANAAIMPAGSNGDVSVYVTQDSDLVIDINGYFASPSSGGLSLYTISPYRVLDTQNLGSGQPITGMMSWNAAAYDCCTPLSAQAFVLNATVAPAGPLGYLTLWPDGSTQPYVSTLNASDGSVASNLAIVPTNNGAIDAYATNSTRLVFDLFGYFAP